MLDVRFIREHPEVVQDAARKKRIDVDVQQFIDVDIKRRELLSKIENLKALRNKTSRDIPKLQGEEKQEAIARMKDVAAESKELEGPLRDVEADFEALLAANAQYSRGRCAGGRKRRRQCRAAHLGQHSRV